jgi:hypothetical protein
LCAFLPTQIVLANPDLRGLPLSLHVHVVGSVDHDLGHTCNRPFLLKGVSLLVAWQGVRRSRRSRDSTAPGADTCRTRKQTPVTPTDPAT